MIREIESQQGGDRRSEKYQGIANDTLVSRTQAASTMREAAGEGDHPSRSEANRNAGLSTHQQEGKYVKKTKCGLCAGRAAPICNQFNCKYTVDNNGFIATIINLKEPK